MWEWLIFGTIAVAGAAFVAAPLLAARRTRLAGVAVAIAVVAAGLGLYAKLGHPQLAARAFETPDPEDLPALTSRLVTAVHDNPDNLQAWLWLGQLYFALGAKEQSAKALGEAVRLARARRLGAAQLAAILSQYGIALSQASGSVTPIAEQALRESVAADPKGQAARFYLGIAAVQRGDHVAAERLWRALLADMDAAAPNRRMVIDQLAALEARRGSAPDIGAMVEGLAARLAANPDDLEGWRRLIRSYAVLGEREKAKAALAKARTQFKADERALTALNETARENKVE